MPRRRYRLFAVCAVVILFMLYRSYNNQWDPTGYGAATVQTETKLPDEGVIPPPDKKPSMLDTTLKDSGAGQKAASGEKGGDGDFAPKQLPPVVAVEPDEGDIPVKKPALAAEDAEEPLKTDVKTEDKFGLDQEPGPPPPLKSLPSSDEEIIKADDSLAMGPGGQKAQSLHDIGADTKPAVGDDKKISEQPIGSQNPPINGGGTHFHEPEPAYRVHWTPVEEHFPVDSLIPLPTGAPKKIPKIQANFPLETESDKAVRVKRQDFVKAQIERSWASYKKYAWMHDELSPISGKFRDPFCGWAATLVDSLDTLWIAGMKDEFDAAAKAVANIDFTYTKRNDIPVFETTIRYLGGLIAAFDLSGGHQGAYGLLLDQAVELAEILMGIFDTPNRMPIMFYQWRPAAASQPHRAHRGGMAEMATLSMEFTRLAQITGKDKYYDAIARITNGLVDMQKEGTVIPGLFPENLDISGCNRTATQIRDSLTAEAKAQYDSDDLLEDPVGFTPGSSGATTTKSSVSGSVSKRDASDSSPLEKRQAPFTSSGKTSEWDCVPQGLIPLNPSYQSFHMGGAQDSAYEYFPKEYLLLGGLAPEYQKLHEDAVDAVDDWLMFRPMASEGWDVLFPAKVQTGSNNGKASHINPTFEITHLTCFIGAMYALGAKAFDRPKDMETARQLTDGCVWAYQITPTGLMPESAKVIPCPTLEKCDYDEKLWHEQLDPYQSWRKTEMEQWEAHQEVLAAEKKTPSFADDSEPDDSGRVKSSLFHDSGIDEDDDHAGAAVMPPMTGGSSSSKLDDVSRAADSTTDKGVLKRDVAETSEANVQRRTPPESKYASSLTKNNKPLTHEEFVESKIKQEKLLPGFTSMSSRAYILRPEAIESVWYMYRTTGDPTWMDKGWAMFESVMAATRTELANSAIKDVMSKTAPGLDDAMESFWIAETLKYYYMLFSEPDLVSLDEWVLNTEAHPFKRPV